MGHHFCLTRMLTSLSVHMINSFNNVYPVVRESGLVAMNGAAVVIA
jgi:hypothetical protein